MREIKFRAWDKHVKKMGKVTEIIFSNVRETLVKYQYIDDYGKTIDEQSHIDDKGHGVAKLLQYTGLKDKNDKEIYEGDIVTTKHYPFQYEGDYHYHGIIEWDEECTSFLIVKHCVNPNIRGISHGIGELLGNIDSEEFEVIGNIYEDKHLLEG